MNIKELNDQELNRLEKIKKYQELGIDPFGQAYDRTHYSSDVQKIVQDFLKEKGVESIDPNDKSDQ